MPNHKELCLCATATFAGAYHLHLVSDELLVCIVASLVLVSSSFVSVRLATFQAEFVAKLHVVQPTTSDDVLDFVVEETVEHGHVDTLIQGDERGHERPCREYGLVYDWRFDEEEHVG